MSTPERGLERAPDRPKTTSIALPGALVSATERADAVVALRRRRRVVSAATARREVERTLRRSRRADRTEAARQLPRLPIGRATVSALAAVALVAGALVPALVAAPTAAGSGAVDAAPLQRDPQALEVAGTAPTVSENVVRAAEVVVDSAVPAGLTSWSCVQNSAGTLRWPLAANCIESSGYGFRTDPSFGGLAFHAGLDLVPGEGTPVLAAADGVIAEINHDVWGLGTNVVVWHPEWQVFTAYGHMKVDSVDHLTVGQEISIGDRVGRVGSTGKSTGAHLHFEVRIPEGAGYETIDPKPWMEERLR